MELEGQVTESRFLRNLVEMGRDRFTGAVRLERDDVIKILYLQDGQIMSASTNDPAESVDEILLRGKKVSREHIQQALTNRKSIETLGDALLAGGFISRKELRWARRHQIVGVLRSVIGDEGEWHYTVVPDYVSSRSSEGTSFAIEPVLIELIVTDPDRKRIEARLEDGEVRLRKVPNFEERYRALGLNEEADRVAAMVDGGRTAAEIAGGAGGNAFMNLKLLAAFRILGILEEAAKAQEQLEISFDPLASRDGLLPGVASAGEIPAWEVENVPAAEPSLDLDIEQDPLEASSWETAPAPSEIDLEAEAPDEIGELDFGEVDELEGDGTEAEETVVEATATASVRRPWWLAAAVLGTLFAVGVLVWWGWMREDASELAAPVPSRPAQRQTPEPSVGGTQVAGTATEQNTRPSERGRVLADDPADLRERGPEEEGTDALRARYDLMAADFARSAGETPYAVQFEIVCQTRSVTLALETGGDSVWFVPIEYRGESCYRVFWGRYRSESEATRAMGEIPAQLRGSRPVVIQPGRVVE